MTHFFYDYSGGHSMESIAAMFPNEAPGDTPMITDEEFQDAIKKAQNENY